MDDMIPSLRAEKGDDDDSSARSAGKSFFSETFPILITVVAIVGVGVLLFRAYQESLKPRDISSLPVIKAEEGPFKIKPKDPGGMEIPNKDKKIYDMFAETDSENDERLEHVVPSPEEPLKRKAVEAEKPAKPLPEEKETKNDTSAEAGVSRLQPEAGPARKVILKETKMPVAKKVEKPASQKPAGKVAVISGVKVQLGSYKSMSPLEDGWKVLKNRFSKELGGLDYTVEKVNLGSKGVYYRLQAGPVESKDAARALCKTLVERKQGCLVIAR